MSELESKNQSAQGNPYSAPRSRATLGASRILTFIIVRIVVLGFVSAGAFAYWRTSTPEVEQDNVQEQIDAYDGAYDKAARIPRPMHRLVNP